MLRSFLSFGINISSSVCSALVFVLYFVSKGRREKKEENAKNYSCHDQFSLEFTMPVSRMRTARWGIPWRGPIRCDQLEIEDSRNFSTSLSTFIFSLQYPYKIRHLILRIQKLIRQAKYLRWRTNYSIVFIRKINRTHTLEEFSNIPQSVFAPTFFIYKKWHVMDLITFLKNIIMWKSIFLALKKFCK